MYTRRSALVLLAGVAALGLGPVACAKKTPLSDDNKAYAGKWVAADGNYVHVFLDGGGNCKIGGTSVEGGSATIAGGKLTIGLFGIEKALSIDEEPSEADGKWSMKLDGAVYTKE